MGLQENGVQLQPLRPESASLPGKELGATQCIRKLQLAGRGDIPTPCIMASQFSNDGNLVVAADAGEGYLIAPGDERMRAMPGISYARSAAISVCTARMAFGATFGGGIGITDCTKTSAWPFGDGPIAFLDKLEGASFHADALQFSQDGRILCCLSDGKLFFFDVSDRNTIVPAGEPTCAPEGSRIVSMSFFCREDQGTLCALTDKGEALLEVVHGGEQKDVSLLLTEPGKASQAAISQDGRFLAIANGCAVDVFDLSSSSLADVLSPSWSVKLEKSVRGIAVEANVIAATDCDKVVTWRFGKKGEYTTEHIIPERSNRVSLSVDAKLLACTDAHGAVSVWRLS